MALTRSGIWQLNQIRNSLADASYGSVVVAQVLLVAGGGTGGSNYPNSGLGIGSGGGAGGVLYSEAVPLSSGYSHVITIGAGGAGATTGNSANGNNTSIVLPEGTFIALGGGRGGGYAAAAAESGGSGGGDGTDRRGTTEGTFSSAFGTSTQTNVGYFTAYGNRGGRATTNTANNSILLGGGGGAGGVGLDANASTNTSGAGGPGITLLGLTIAGGGGSNGYNGGSSAGGSGGGGSTTLSGAARSGTANTGGGGGGGGYVETNGAGSGGSGVVVIRYLDSSPPAIVSGNPTYTATGGFRTYVFTGNGTIAF
jgi:hypothetical protein